MLFQLFPYRGISQKITFVRHTGVKPFPGRAAPPQHTDLLHTNWEAQAQRSLQKNLWTIFYFHLTYILFLLMPTVVKIQPLNIFNNNIQRRPQDGDTTPLQYLYWCIFFFCVHVPLSVYFLLSPSVVFSATVSIPNVYIGSSTTLF